MRLDAVCDVLLADRGEPPMLITSMSEMHGWQWRAGRTARAAPYGVSRPLRSMFSEVSQA